MSNNNDPSRNVTYDPLPLTNDDHPSHNLYNAPPSPDPHLSTYYTPQMDPVELRPDESAIPLGAAQPRFLGAAFYGGAGSPSMRNSLASSSNHTIPGARSEYNSSLYALNDPQGTGRFDSVYRDDPRDTMLMSDTSATGRMMEEKRAGYAVPRPNSKRKIIIGAVIVSLALIILAVIIPLYFLVLKPSTRTTSNPAKATASFNAASPSSTSTSSGMNNVRVTGGDGSVITMENGTTFTYRNPFGGYWYWDENDPFNDGARAQSWSPALNETFNYGVDQIRGLVFRL